MKKKKKPTMKELTQIVANIDSGLKGMSNVLRMYMEYKGDLVMFNEHLAQKQREHQEKMKEKDGNTD